MHRSPADFVRAVLAAAIVAACSSSDNAEGAGPGAATRSPDTGASRSAAPEPLSETEAAVRRADSARIQGSPSAPIWIVEVSDFQCPYCRQWHTETYEPLRREFVATGRVRLAYVNFPLPNHRNAVPAAEAAMCAGAQGKFWQMHDALFHDQARWGQAPDPAAVFDTMARAVGVMMPEYRRCTTGRVMRRIVEADFARAEEAGVNSTPTFIIDNRFRLSGAQPIEAFREAIDSALAATPGRR